MENTDAANKRTLDLRSELLQRRYLRKNEYKTDKNSGRSDSNRRRPAWEAGILPLNYARNILLIKDLQEFKIYQLLPKNVPRSPILIKMLPFRLFLWYYI